MSYASHHIPIPGPRFSSILAASAFGCLLSLSLALQANSQELTHLATQEFASQSRWNGFRGGSVTGAIESNSPTIEWSESTNVLWKAETPGRAWASPVEAGGVLWLATATEDGKEMSILGYDFETGKQIVHKRIFENESLQPDFDKTNSYASPTPTTDGRTLFVHFGAYGTAAIDIHSAPQNPNILWTRRDLPCNHFRGPGSSPVLYRDLLIFHMDGFDFQYVIALEASTGKTVWKVDRDIDYGTTDGDVMKAFGTPSVISVEGSDVLLSPTSKAMIAMDPTSGNELWRVTYDEFSTASKPLFDGEHIFINTGFGKAKLMAIRPTLEALSPEERVLWTNNRGIGSKPSPVVYRNWLFSSDDRGIITCVDKVSGEVVWQKRVGGQFSSSPLVVGNKLFCFDEDGTSYVFQADGTGTLIRTNQLDQGCMASPAYIDETWIIRTRDALYAIRSNPSP